MRLISFEELQKHNRNLKHGLLFRFFRNHRVRKYSSRETQEESFIFTVGFIQDFEVFFERSNGIYL